MAWNKAMKAWATGKAARREGGRRSGWLIITTTYDGKTRSRFYFTDEIGNRKTQRTLDGLRLP